MNEKDIRSHIRQMLQIHGWKITLMTAGPVSEKGIPDMLCYGPKGWRMDIEVKTPDGKQSDHQKEYQAEIERRGHVYLLARSWEDVDDYLEAREWK